MILSILNNKDILLFIVVIALIVISIMMVYLVYSQNKQLTKELTKKDNGAANEMMELRELSKKLEKVPKSNKNNVSIGYESEQLVNNIEIKKVDLDKTGEIELDPIKKELNSKISLGSYEHEEEFLRSIKELQYLLTK